MRPTGTARRTLLVTCFWLAVSGARADVRLPQIFGDSMVLQRDVPISIWGWADPGEKVSVTVGEEKGEATASDDGKWKIKLGCPPAGGPLAITVAGKNTITLSDVLVGEVWVCSGQSNMQFAVRQVVDGEKEIAAADYPSIRLFTVKRAVAEKPLDDCEGNWTACTPETVAGFTAVGYFFGRSLHRELDVPVGLINSSWGGTVCEAWTSHEALVGNNDFKPILSRAAEFNPKTPNQASNLFNGMIHPLIPLGIRGAIWYQGEANCNRAKQYRKLFPTMISDWRKQWGQGEFPFLYVQLAPYRYKHDPACCAELWEAQFATLSLPGTGMAVTTDVGDPKDIHPKNKQEVGRRLALWALAKTYGKDLVYSGPLYKAMRVEGDKIRLLFNHVGGGLVSRDGEPLSDFTICGRDKQFVPASASIDGETIVVSSDQVAQPVAVRFAWRDDAEPNLSNAEGLPASPFRTDRFEMVTAGNL